MASRFNPLYSAVIDIDDSGNNTVISATTGRSIKVHKMFFIAESGVTITMYDGSSTALSGPMKFVGSQGMVLDIDEDAWFTTTAGNAFVMNLDIAVQVSGTIYYTLE